VLLGTSGAPLFALVLYAIARHSLSIGAVAAMVASGVFALGGLLGFLFGIPRVLASQAEQSAGAASGDAPFRYLPNSNLEQVSDWLTKILIGVGLVELTSLVKSIGLFADTLEPALERKVVNAALGEFEKQGKADAEAQRLTSQQLDLSEDDPSTQDLKAAIAAASGGMKKQIFDQARRERQTGWRGRNQRRIAATEPVFRALAADDKEERFHRHFAQLGYVLKDSDHKDLRAAEENLSKAIDIRNRNRESGYRIYELNRALCRIALDKREPPQPSDPETKERILDDLRAAAAERYPRDIIRRDATVQRWLKLNEASIDPSEDES